MSSKPPRGFVKQARSIAMQERRELGLAVEDQLDPWKLAQAHGIQVIELTRLGEFLDDQNQLTRFVGQRAHVFSAGLLPDGNGCLIIENDSHAPPRRRANIAHELGHLLLEHPFHPSLLLDDCRGTTGSLEVQANRLAQELLIPRQAVIAALRRGVSDAQIAEHFGVSEAYARMQINMSGARRQVAREQATVHQ